MTRSSGLIACPAIEWAASSTERKSTTAEKGNDKIQPLIGVESEGELDTEIDVDGSYGCPSPIAAIDQQALSSALEFSAEKNPSAAGFVRHRAFLFSLFAP
jgi:hypothetical protein